MIDREPLPRSDNSGAQASECRCGLPRGAARAAGGLLYPANRRMIVVQEPANGESQFKYLLREAGIDIERDRVEIGPLPVTTEPVISFGVAAGIIAARARATPPSPPPDPRCRKSGPPVR
jgi:hypothetical protein